MEVVTSDSNRIIYRVTAPAAVVSTTQVRIPPGLRVSNVDGADSWSFASQIATVQVTHTSTRRVTLFLNPFTPLSANSAEGLGVVVALYFLP